MKDLSDAELVRKCLSGNTASFNGLVWRWQKPVLNFLYRFIGNYHDAEDVCQRTFLKAYRKMRLLSDPEKFRVWLFQIAANEARDFLRQRKRRNWFSLNFIHSNKDGEEEIQLDLADSGEMNGEDRLHRAELQKILSAAAKKIPQKQRAVIILKIYQGLTFNEIAEILQEPVNTVKSRLYYGLKAMRQVLQEQNLSEEVLRHEM